MRSGHSRGADGKVPSRSKPLRCVSGIISSLTTKSMAPAAKAKPMGKSGRAMVTAAAPKIPALGSARPESVAYHSALPRLYFYRNSGSATASPSGMFCSARSPCCPPSERDHPLSFINSMSSRRDCRSSSCSISSVRIERAISYVTGSASLVNSTSR